MCKIGEMWASVVKNKERTLWTLGFPCWTHNACASRASQSIIVYDVVKVLRLHWTSALLLLQVLPWLGKEEAVGHKLWRNQCC